VFFSASKQATIRTSLSRAHGISKHWRYVFFGKSMMLCSNNISFPIEEHSDWLETVPISFVGAVLVHLATVPEIFSSSPEFDLAFQIC
jgi:hypothetical protein